MIELLIVMLMISFVLAAGYSMYILGAKSYTSGMNRSDAQFECRKAVQFISKTVRTSKQVTLQNTYPSSSDAYEYLYIDTTTHLLMYRPAGADNQPIVEAGVANTVTFSQPTFSCPAPGILRIYLECSAVTGTNTQPSSITSDIKLLNYASFPLGTSGSVLKITY